MSFEIVDEILIRDLKNQEIDYHEWSNPYSQIQHYIAIPLNLGLYI